MRRVLLLVLVPASMAALALASPVEAHRSLRPALPPFERATSVSPDAPTSSPAIDADPVGRAPVSTEAPAAVPQRRAQLVVLLGAALGAATVLVRRPRIRISVALVFLLAVFACESALHSVHHLGEAGRAAACPVAIGAEHLAGTETDAVTVAGVPGPVGLAPVGWVPPVVPFRTASPHEGRAPPVSV